MPWHALARDPPPSPRRPKCSLCVGIIFISYALQVKYRPFVDPNLDAVDAAVAQSKLPAAGLVYVRVGPGLLCIALLSSHSK